MRVFRRGTAFLLTSGLALMGSTPAAEQIPFTEAEKILARYCYECHGNNDETREADLNLEFLQTEEAWQVSHDLLDDALFTVEEGDMPPKKADQPTEEERELLVAWLDQSIETVAAAAKNDPGLVVAPRLNHIEYDLVIRDLTGLPGLAPARLFPRDSGGGEGFTNVGADLVMETGLLENWLEAARGVVQHAFVFPIRGLEWQALPAPAASAQESAYFPVRQAWQQWHEGEFNRQWRGHQQRFKVPGIDADDAWLVAYLEGAWVYENRQALGLGTASLDEIALQQKPPLLPALLEGFHEMLTRDPSSFDAKWAGQAELAKLWQKIPNARRASREEAAAACLEIGKKLDKPGNSPLRGLARDLGKPSTSGLGGQIWTAFTPYPGMGMDLIASKIEQEKSLEAEVRDLDTHPYYFLAPDIRRNASPESIAKLEALIEEAKRIYHADIAADRQLAESIIGDFAGRAWRRPLTADELGRLMDLYDHTREETGFLQAAVRQAMVAVLVSPRFLYRFQQSEGATEARPLKPRELATRLAFALWGTLPDDELFAAADSGALSTSDGLKAETERLMASPKARTMGRQFAGQWLHFADFAERAQPDPERFEDFSPEHARDMEEQAVRFFVDAFQANRTLDWLIEADSMELSARLAGYYGLKDTSKMSNRNGQLDQWTRYDLPEKQRGVLSLGAVLVGKSQPLRSSPIKRGAWVVLDLLGTPMPEPPMVPPLSDDEVSEDGMTLAKQMEIHRKDPSCSSCHVKLDPMGLALENYGPDGRWRDADIQGNPLETVTTAPDGSTIEGVTGLANYLLKPTQKEQIARQFSRKLLGYLLGRKVDLGDRDLVDDMVEAMENDGWQLMPALHTALSSPQFLTRRDEPASS